VWRNHANFGGEFGMPQCGPEVAPDGNVGDLGRAAWGLAQPAFKRDRPTRNPVEAGGPPTSSSRGMCDVEAIQKDVFAALPDGRRSPIPGARVHTDFCTTAYLCRLWNGAASPA